MKKLLENFANADLSNETPDEFVNTYFGGNIKEMQRIAKDLLTAMNQEGDTLINFDRNSIKRTQEYYNNKEQFLKVMMEIV